MSYDSHAVVGTVVFTTVVSYVGPYLPALGQWLFDECFAICTDLVIEPLVTKRIVPIVRKLRRNL